LKEFIVKNFHSYLHYCFISVEKERNGGKGEKGKELAEGKGDVNTYTQSMVDTHPLFLVAMDIRGEKRKER